MSTKSPSEERPLRPGHAAVYAAVLCLGGISRRVWFEADCRADALKLSRLCGAELEAASQPGVRRDLTATQVEAEASIAQLPLDSTRGPERNVSGAPRVHLCSSPTNRSDALTAPATLEEVRRSAIEAIAEVRALRHDIESILRPQNREIHPNTAYRIEEAAPLVGMSGYTLRKKLRARIIVGRRQGRRAPWLIAGSELLKLTGRR